MLESDKSLAFENNVSYNQSQNILRDIVMYVNLVNVTLCCLFNSLRQIFIVFVIVHPDDLIYQN